MPKTKTVQLIDDLRQIPRKREPLVVTEKQAMSLAANHHTAEYEIIGIRIKQHFGIKEK